MPYTKVPAHLSSLTLAEANQWGAAYDAARAAGKSAEVAARIAWGAVRNRKGDARRAPPRPQHPVGLERQYVGRLLKRVRAASHLAEERIRAVLARRGLRHDAQGDDPNPSDVPASAAPELSTAIEAASGSFAQVYAPEPAPLVTQAVAVDRYATAQATQQLARIGVVERNAKGEPSVVKIDPTRGGKDRAIHQAWARENVDLITSLDDQFFDDLTVHVQQAVEEGVSTKDLIGVIRDRTGVAESRARLIAVDQIGKLNGQITKQRHLDVGITRYEWSTSDDERVRPMHRALEGTIHSWGSPPVTNPAGDRNDPGGDYRCRCSAIPHVDSDEALGMVRVEHPPAPEPAPVIAPAAVALAPVRVLPTVPEPVAIAEQATKMPDVAFTPEQQEKITKQRPARVSAGQNGAIVLYQPAGSYGAAFSEVTIGPDGKFISGVMVDDEPVPVFAPNVPVDLPISSNATYHPVGVTKEQMGENIMFTKDPAVAKGRRAAINAYIDEHAPTVANGKLTSQERAVVHKYQQASGFREINSGLRAGNKHEVVDTLDSVIERSRVPGHVVAYRGISPRQALSRGIISGEIVPGDVVEDAAYTSVSLLPETAARFGDAAGNDRVILAIDIPPNRPALLMDRQAQEQEVILPRNAKLRIKSVRKEGGITVVEAVYE